MKRCAFVAILVLSICTLPVAAQSDIPAPQAASQSGVDTSKNAPPERPITKDQLQQWMELTTQLETNRTRLQAGLDKIRNTVPPWIPDSVWNDFKANVAQIDFVAVLLPVYQQFFSQQDGAAMLLMVEGPTGHEYARLMLQSRVNAMNHGLQGSAAEAQAMQADKAANLDELRRKRLAELTPDEVAQVHALDDHTKRTAGGDVWRQLDDQQDVVMRAKINEVFQTTMKAHNDELVAAQRAYLAQHPAKP